MARLLKAVLNQPALRLQHFLCNIRAVREDHFFLRQFAEAVQVRLFRHDILQIVVVL